MTKRTERDPSHLERVRAHHRLIATSDLRRETKQADDDAVKAAKDAIVAALQAGISPTEVEQISPFSPTYTRAVARAGGIKPARPGIKTDRNSGRSGA